MSKKKRLKQRSIRAKPDAQAEAVKSWLCSQDAFDMLTTTGYTRLSECPEVLTAVDTIARLVGSMTIHLMKNTDSGDVRIKDGLAKKIDVYPYSRSTRASFIYWIVRTLIIEGEGNCTVFPKTKNGLIDDLLPIPPAIVSYIPDGYWNYTVLINGREYDPDEVLHFVLNPSAMYPWKGEGYKVALSAVANNLKQAAATTAGFLKSKWKPSLIVKVDGMTEQFAGVEGRRRLLNEYMTTDSAGEPWIVPAEQFDIEQVRPLSLADLAISDTVQMDKKTVAGILGVPAFLMGVGEFNRNEWNNFINSKIKPLAQSIEQELTKKLLYSPDLFFRFNSRSLFSYDLKELASVGDEQYIKGIMTGNEVRDWIGLPPKEGLDKLIILENYIPLDKVADQKKLKGGGDDDKNDD